MSDKSPHEANVKVLNEEYERLLANPDNIIVSDDLQELLDLPMQGDDSPGTIDTMVISVLDSQGLPTSVRGEFQCLSKSGIGYSLILSATKIKKEFLQCIDTLGVKKGLLTVQGEYDLEIQDCELISWSVTQTTAGDFSFSVQFRSEDGIF